MKTKFQLSIAQRIALSFLTVILIGSILLTLPFSQAATSQATYFDNLFNTVSAVCVTGLYTQPVYLSYTPVGQFIFMLLIQIGGLGIMTILAFIILTVGKTVRFRDKKAISEALNKTSLGDFKKYIINIIKYVALIEGIGFLLLLKPMIRDFGLPRGIFNALFLAISSFCNAGFDNWNSASLQSYVHDHGVTVPVMLLITLGGIGFAVWFDISQQASSYIKKGIFDIRQWFKKIKTHTRLALSMTGKIIISGTILVMLIEFTNPNTLGALNLLDKILVSMFQIVTHRTAGFASIDLTLFHPASLLIFCLVMLIGASPGGTGGGIKTTTIGIVILLIYHELISQNEVTYHNHTIRAKTVRKALVITALFLGVLFIGILAMLIFDGQSGFHGIVFEAISAFTTTGTTLNLTPLLSRASHSVLMCLMFFGRIGPLTIFLSLSNQEEKTQKQYAQADILIG